VWLDEPRLVCVSPAAGGDESFFSAARVQRGFAAVIEALLLQYDRVVIDTSGLVSAAKSTLFQICDQTFFVVNRDASAAFANRQALSLIAGFLKPDAALATMINDTGVGTSSVALLKEQVVVIAGRAISYITVPRSPKAAAWVCSGYTPYRFLRRSLRDVVFAAKGGEPLKEGFLFLKAAKSTLVGLKRIVGRWALFDRFRWRKSGRNSASGEPWGVRPTLDAPPGLLSIGHAIPDDNLLVSKPVLLG